MIENYFSAVYRVETSTRDENIITISPLNSLKPFEFEPKTNIRDINISSSDVRKKVLKIKQSRQETVSGASPAGKYWSPGRPEDVSL